MSSHFRDSCGSTPSFHTKHESENMAAEKHLCRHKPTVTVTELGIPVYPAIVLGLEAYFGRTPTPAVCLTLAEAGAQECGVLGLLKSKPRTITDFGRTRRGTTWKGFASAWSKKRDRLPVKDTKKANKPSVFCGDCRSR